MSAPDAVALAAGNQNALTVRLQRWDPVDDVDSGLLELLRPLEVRPLVESSLELHHADRLLAALRSVDQRGNKRGVGTGPIDGLLDRQDVRIGDGLPDERFNR